MKREDKKIKELKGEIGYMRVGKAFYEKGIEELKSEIERLRKIVNAKVIDGTIRIDWTDELVAGLKSEIERLKIGIEANKPESFCINCGHAIDMHGGDTIDDLNHCADCQEIGKDCTEFKPAQFIGQIINARELQKDLEWKEKIRKMIDELQAELDKDSKEDGWYKDQYYCGYEVALINTKQKFLGEVKDE